MDHLIELVQFLSKNKFKHLEVFAPNSRLLQFYEKLRDGSLKTEQEARTFFFPKNKNAQTYYYRLAQQLEERLLSLLFLVDFHQTASNETQKDALTCYRNYAAVNSLLVRFMRAPAIKLAEETIKIALKNEFTDIVLPLARHLMVHYGSTESNKKKYHHYLHLVEYAQQLLNAEIIAEKHYTEIMFYYVLKRSADLVFAKKIGGYADELRTYMQRLSSYRLNLFAHMVFVFQHQLMADYEKTVDACREALQFFEQQSHKSSRAIIITIASRMASALHMMGHYTEGIELIKKNLPLAPSNNINWFAFKELILLLYLHGKAYEDALDIIIDVKNNPVLSKQPALAQERWRVSEAMVYYLIRTNKLKQPQGVDFKFRTKKFINEFSGSIHDKSGNNILLITLQIMFLLLDKDYSSIIDKVDALKAYTHRHLRRDETYRTNCFIKMIMQLDKGDFHPVAVQRKAEPYYQKLLEVPLSKAKQDYDLEIIPYETLWSFILESLPSSHRTKVQGN